MENFLSIVELRTSLPFKNRDIDHIKRPQDNNHSSWGNESAGGF